MRDLLRPFVACLAVAIAAIACQDTPSPASLREAGLAAETRHDTAAALAALDQGLLRSPNDPGLLAAKGRVYWRILRTKSAEEAFIAAAGSAEYAAEAQYGLGQIYGFKGWKAENAFPGWHEEVSYRPRAIAAFTAARDARPEWALPYVGLADAFKADGRDAEAEEAYARARELGWTADPEPDAVEKANALVATLAASGAPIAELRAAIDARIALRPDPMSYSQGANALLARGEELDHVVALATEGPAAGERFVRENESSYKLDGKVQGSLDRNQAGFADQAGWAAFLQGDLVTAESRLAEAARLSRSVDATNQMHLAALSARKQDGETAREHYLTVLGLAGASPAQREEARTALAGIETASGEDPAGFDRWLAATLDRRREQRRAELVSNMTGKMLPEVKLTDLQGHPVDLEAERGNVVLLNFFSAW